jgi:hypothetical protein
LKEALFLSVWLRRQEAQVFQVRILAQGLADLATKESHVAEIFKEYTESVFPFTKGQQDSKDAEMKAVMKREVDKGMLTFQAHPVSFLRNKAQEMLELPEDFKKKLAAKAAAKGKK